MCRGKGCHLKHVILSADSKCQLTAEMAETPTVMRLKKKRDTFYKINAYSEILIFKVLLLNDPKKKKKTISLLLLSRCKQVCLAQ